MLISLTVKLTVQLPFGHFVKKNSWSHLTFEASDSRQRSWSASAIDHWSVRPERFTYLTDMEGNSVWTFVSTSVLTVLWGPKDLEPSKPEPDPDPESEGLSVLQSCEQHKLPDWTETEGGNVSFWSFGWTGPSQMFRQMLQLQTAKSLKRAALICALIINPNLVSGLRSKTDRFVS